MKKKAIILITIIAVVLLIVFVSLSSNDDESHQDIYTVEMGSIVQEIFEAGTIKKGDEINLSFASSGKIKEIYSQEGDVVEKDDVLAKLDDDVLNINLEKAKSNLGIAEINLQKRISVGSNQDIQSAQIVVNNAKTALNSAIQNLEETRRVSDEKISNLYNDSLSVINNSILSSEMAYDDVNIILEKYFPKFYNQDSRDGTLARDRIKASSDEIKYYKELGDIDKTLEVAEKNLKSIFEDMNAVINILNQPIYQDISQADKITINTQKNNINQSLNSVTSIIGAISLAKSVKSSELTLAQSQKKSTEGALAQAQNELERMMSSARDEDINLARLQLEQAQKEVELLEKMIDDSVIKAPFKGKVIRVNYKNSEIVQPGVPVMTIISEDDYQVELNIYEGDIAKISIGDPAEIKVVALPGEEFSGAVSFIDVASRLIDSVIYYKTLVNIDNPSDKMKVGMTADVIITPSKKDNVLIIPERAVSNSVVTLIKDDGSTEDVVVKLGLRGSNRMVEVLSGLNLGDKIIVSR